MVKTISKSVEFYISSLFLSHYFTVVPEVKALPEK
jgi:hypothetical protein